MKRKSTLQSLFKQRLKDLPQIFLDNFFWFKIILALFVVSFIGGVVTYFNPSLNVLTPIIQNAINDLANLAQEIKNYGFFGKAWLIFLNNLSVASLMLFGGLIVGIIPVLIILLNGLILGFFVAMILASHISLGEKAIMMFILIPHGVVELFSAFLASSFGLKLGTEYIFVKKGERKKVFLKNLKFAFLVLAIATTGLLIASVIEIADMKIGQFLLK